MHLVCTSLVLILTPIFQVYLLAVWQLYDYQSASNVTLTNMAKQITLV